MPYFCYMLECSDGSFYTGWSVNPKKRTVIHNTGQGARYTRMHRPVRLVYVEELPDRSSAQKREQQIKTLKHTQKENLIDQARLDLEDYWKRTPGCCDQDIHIAPDAINDDMIGKS